jgi:glycosyltransferase involved in cell wall biosynthesis
MKIAYLSKEYPPYGLNFAGAIFYPKLASGLCQQGHEVHVISQAPRHEDEYMDQGIFIHRIGPPPKSGSALTRMRYNLAAWRKLRQLVGKYAIEIVDAPVTFGEGFMYSLRKHTPLILQTFAFSDMFVRTKSYSGISELFSFKISSCMEDMSLKLADRVVANSPQTYGYLLNEIKIPAQRINLIWESRIDLGRFHFTSSDARTRLEVPVDEPLILYVGWLQARKGVHILCEAIPSVLSHFPGAVFVLLGRDTKSAPGGGSFKQYILEHARRQGFLRHIKIIDEFIPENELIELYSACDLFVLPSLSETFGWPVIEAMACNRPVVATTTGVAPEFANVSQALKVVPPGNAKALVQAIIKILSMSREERGTSASSHRRIVEERFSLPKMVQSYISVYEEVIAEYYGRKADSDI